MNVDRVLGRAFADVATSYSARDTILYALGTGYASLPLDRAHLRFLYEDGLVAAPTFANVLGHPGFWARDPAYAIDWPRLLHAEQRLVIHRPLPASGRVIGCNAIMGVRDRGAGSGAMLFQRKSVMDAADGALLASVTTTLMLRGDGGCGDHGSAPDALPGLPGQAPDTSLEVATLEITPLIYRLSGDLNPLHVDPAVSAGAGFPRPILHGLAIKGFAGYALLRMCCDLDPQRLRTMALRFTSPVLPGDTIRFDIWGRAPGTVRFRAVVAAREAIVLDRGVAELA